MTTEMHEKIQVLLDEDCCHECEGYGEDHVCVHIEAIAELPTRFGDFHIVAFSNNKDDKEHVAIIKGDVIGADDVPVRLHSECLTGDAIGSLRCDCRDQLEASLKKIGEMERGMVLYLRQEGRGIGLTNKIRAYTLQDQGLDTVEANVALGFEPEQRSFEVAAQILKAMGMTRVALLSNNPDKSAALTAHGIDVTVVRPLTIEPNPHNIRYMETKRDKFGHVLNLE